MPYAYCMASKSACLMNSGQWEVTNPYGRSGCLWLTMRLPVVYATRVKPARILRKTKIFKETGRGFLRKIQHFGNIEEGDFPHSTAGFKALIPVHPGEFLSQAAHFLVAGYSVLTHTGAKPFDPDLGKVESSFNQGALLPLVL